MGKEYRAKVFKSGNSVALRLPKALGLRAGDEMLLREESRGYALEPVAIEPEHFDLTGIAGSVPGITRPAWDDRPRDWTMLD